LQVDSVRRDEMLKDIIGESEEKMKKAVESVAHELAGIRTGRASASLLDAIKVEAYGAMVPVKQMANIGIPDPKLIVVQPWDRTLLGELEKAILKSDLGLTPASDGNVIRLHVPPLTEERRKELVRLVKKLAEEGKIAIRNIRRESNDRLKAAERDGSISEDESRRAHKRTQELTDSYSEQVDAILARKEEEIMTV
jgi:ribosome recycling factor